jgi:hypothetical protein
MDTQKICTKCQNLKNISLFRNDKRLKNGKGSVCLDCTRAYALSKRNNNLEKARESYTKWAKNNKDYLTQKKVAWAKENPEKKKEADKKSYEKNKNKRLFVQKHSRSKNSGVFKERAKEWRKNNMGYVISKNAERHAAKLYRTPKWLTKEQKQEIQEFYKMAKELQKIFPWEQHVDHIIPLQGKLVSGLHVPNNLQILSVHLNCSKKNKY